MLSMSDECEKSHSLGAHDCLLKPVQKEALFAALKGHIQQNPPAIENDTLVKETLVVETTEHESVGKSTPEFGRTFEEDFSVDESLDETITIGTTDLQSRGRILIVDDNPMNRDLLVQRLQRQGYQTAVAENGRIALEKVAASPFDLVLLDIMMPEMDGYQVLEKLKSDPALRHIPVIMISALTETESAVRCIASGAEDYLHKPFDPVLLKARTESSLEKKRLRDGEVRLHQKQVQLYDELQQSHEKLVELEGLRDSLTHMIVHDLRTPLTSLLGGLESMAVVGELDAIQQECLDIACQGGHDLLGMINDLLDISKMEAGQIDLEMTEIEAPKLLGHALQHVAELLASGQQNLVRDIAEHLPAFSGDQEKLRRVLVNLVGNAIKFTPRNGTITVAACLQNSGESSNTQMLFSISDTGEGIPLEAFEHIFEKFGQVKDRKAGRRMSTGLGLTFCKMAVEAHGGQIWVESEIGKGSTFFFTLPLNNTE